MDVTATSHGQVDTFINVTVTSYDQVNTFIDVIAISHVQVNTFIDVTFLSTLTSTQAGPTPSTTPWLGHHDPRPRIHLVVGRDLLR